jgi:ABC-type nitrate/sulfonate/bicarbonate transport system ATPase subunit
MTNPILTFSNVSFKYHNGMADVLHDVSFSLEKKSFTILVGPSGCGKSTLIKLAAGLTQASSGSLNAPKKMSMVFQNGALLPWYSALENVLLALDSVQDGILYKEKRALDALAMMNIKELASKYPRDLSGGQRQRVGIARALAAEPELLLLDEPFSALDAETTEALHSELLDIWKSRDITILMISHSLEEAVTLGERILVMHEGHIVHEHIVKLVYPRDPTSETFAKYIASIRKELKEKRKSMVK